MDMIFTHADPFKVQKVRNNRRICILARIFYGARELRVGIKERIATRE